MRIVKALDEVEDCKSRLARILEAVLNEQFALKRSVETLAHRIIVTISDGTHRRSNTGFAAAVAERNGCILAALVRVVNDVGRLALRDRHVERSENEISPQMRFHRPTDDAATEDVEDDRNEEEARKRWHVRYVGNPQLIRSRRRKLALDEVRRRSSVTIAYRCLEALASARSSNIVLPHQTSDTFIAGVKSRIPKIGLNPRSTVILTRISPRLFNASFQDLIGLPPPRERSLEPRIIAAGRDVQHAALRSDGPYGLMRFHEFEDLGGIESVSRANQAAAFPRISRSILSCFTSLRSRASSEFSAEFKPSLRRPVSRSACLIQFRTVCPASLNSAASSSADDPIGQAR